MKEGELGIIIRCMYQLTYKKCDRKQDLEVPECQRTKKNYIKKD